MLEDVERKNLQRMHKQLISQITDLIDRFRRLMRIVASSKS